MEARCILATIALRDGPFAAAGRWLQEASAIAPAYPPVHYYLALWRPERGDIAGMEASLSRARLLLASGSKMAASLDAFADAWRWLGGDIDVAPLPTTALRKRTGESASWLFVWRDLGEFLEHFDRAQVGTRHTLLLPKRTAGHAADPSEQLLRQAEDSEPDIAVFLPGTAQYRNPSLDTFRQLRRRGIPTVLFVPDLRKVFWQGIAGRIADAFDLVVSVDGCSLETLPTISHLGRRFLRGWSPIAAAPIPPFATRRPCVNLVGSLWGARVAGVEALRRAGVEVVTRPATAEGPQDSGLVSHKTLSTASYLDSLRQAQLTVNFSACITGDGHQLKCRVLEAAACGSMLLESANEVTRDFFEEGREFISFDGIPDLLEKVRYFLAHPEIASGIATNATSRFLKHYTATAFWTRVLATARENHALDSSI